MKGYAVSFCEIGVMKCSWDGFTRNLTGSWISQQLASYGHILEGFIWVVDEACKFGVVRMGAKQIGTFKIDEVTLQ